MNITTNRIIRKNPAVCVTTLDGELVVMNNETQVYYRINTSGSRIWDIVSSHNCTLQQIVHFMAEHYHLPAENLSADVTLFINLMLKKGIFQLSEDE